MIGGSTPLSQIRPSRDSQSLLFTKEIDNIKTSFFIETISGNIHISQNKKKFQLFLFVSVQSLNFNWNNFKRNIYLCKHIHLCKNNLFESFYLQKHQFKIHFCSSFDSCFYIYSEKIFIFWRPDSNPSYSESYIMFDFQWILLYKNPFFPDAVENFQKIILPL